VAKDVKAVLVLIVLLLAGCATPGSDDAVLDAKNPPTGPTSFTLVGLVQTTSFEPIAGATVTLLGTGKNTTTAADGTFTFTRLNFVTTLVRIEADGYATQTLRVDPVAEKMGLDVQMTRHAVLPYQVSVKFRGHIECAAEALIISGPCDAVWTYGGQNPLLDSTNVFDLRVEDRWMTVVGDVVFDGSAQPGLNGLRVSVRGLNDQNATGVYEQYARFHGPSSFTFALQPGETYPSGKAPTPANGTTFRFEVLPHSHGYHATCLPTDLCPLGVGAGANIEFELLLTAFYVEAAPEGWKHA
jgi:hypothetical protein